MPGGWAALRARGHDLAIVARDLLCDALATSAPAPDEMIGAMVSVPLPPSSVDEAPPAGAYDDPVHASLLEAGIQVAVGTWPQRPERSQLAANRPRQRRTVRRPRRPRAPRRGGRVDPRRRLTDADRRRDARPRPDPPARRVGARGDRGRRRLAERVRAGDGRWRRNAIGPVRAAPRARRRWAAVLHESRRAARGATWPINPWSAAAFWWPALDRQARVTGPVRLLPEEESLAYWRTRPRGSQLSATVSAQGQEIGSRAELEALVRDLDAQIPGRASAAADLGRLPHRPADDRVLGEPARPAPRPRRVPARRGRVVASASAAAVGSSTVVGELDHHRRVARRAVVGRGQQRADQPADETGKNRATMTATTGMTTYHVEREPAERADLVAQRQQRARHPSVKARSRCQSRTVPAPQARMRAEDRADHQPQR